MKYTAEADKGNAREMASCWQYYDTVLSFGLTKEEEKHVDLMIETVNELSEKVNKAGEERHVFSHKVCEDYRDMLAIPACVIVTRFENYSEEELCAFNECFSESQAAVIAMDTFPGENGFNYYQNVDFKNKEEMQDLLLMRILIVLSHHNKAKNIILDRSEGYSIVEVKENKLYVLNYKYSEYKDVEVEKVSTIDNMPALDNIIFYNAAFSVGDERGDLREISNGYADLHLLISAEYPVTAIMNLDEKVEFLCPDAESADSLHKKALLLDKYFESNSIS